MSETTLRPVAGADVAGCDDKEILERDLVGGPRVTYSVERGVYPRHAQAPCLGRRAVDLGPARRLVRAWPGHAFVPDSTSCAKVPAVEDCEA